MNVLFKGIDLLTMTSEGFLHNVNVAVADGKIAYVGKGMPTGLLTQKVVSGQDKLLMPGLVNAHTHLPMVAMRGYAGDMNLQKWLFDMIFPVEAKWDEECIEIATKLAICESLASGTTSVSDMYFFLEGMARAVSDSGIRANLSRGLSLSEGEDAEEKVADALDFIKRYDNTEDGRLKADLGVHAEYTSSPELWRAVADAYAREPHCIQIHLSETESEHEACKQKYGATPTALLDSYGLITADTLCAHGVYLEEGDMDILAARGASVAHCPMSNLKLGSGVARVPKLIGRGINLAIGTDGASSNNNTDMFAEMKIAALLQKGLCRDPEAVSAKEILSAATVGGGRAQGRDVGCIEAGRPADLVLLDTGSAEMFPALEPYSAAVYSAGPSSVIMTMVDGNILYEKGEFKSLDREKLKAEFKTKVIPKLYL